MTTTVQNTGLDLIREKQEQQGDEWVFGAASPVCLFAVPIHERKDYLPHGEIQRGREGFQDCVTRAYLNDLEIKLTRAYRLGILKPETKKWLDDNGYVVTRKGKRFVEFSDRFIAIKSGTTRTGNSFKAPAHAIHEHGLIPKRMFPAEKWMTWEDYHDPSKITDQMERLGKEFKERLPTNYEQVYLTDLETALKNDIVAIGGYAWPEIANGEYPRVDGPFSHAFIGFDLPKTYIFDNYPDTFTRDGKWVKKLASNYNLYPYGYRIYISGEYTPEEIKERNSLKKQAISLIKKLIQVISETIDSISPPPAYDKDPSELPMNQPPEAVKPEDPPRFRLLAAAQRWLGKDASPSNKAPDEFACAEACSHVINDEFGDFQSTVSTIEMKKILDGHSRFKRTLKLDPGNVILSATGEGRNGHIIPNGHVGILLESGRIASNNSPTGTWENNYSVTGWVDRFRKRGGYPIYVYERV